MRTRIFIVVTFSVLVAGGYLWSWRPVQAGAAPQQKRGARKTPAPDAAPEAAASKIDYSHFSHRSEKHTSLACDACHQAPTENWVAAAGFPDVADYPKHADCVRCHRAEFFVGARPAICSVCHTKVSPRDEARFAFAKPKTPSEFQSIFPHDRHQDVIAAVRTERRLESAHANLSSGQMQTPAPAQTPAQTAAQKYNNCTICHGAETRQIAPAAIEGFSPPVGTFRTSPIGHASCFSCHWQNQAPTHLQCAGCHQISAKDVLPVTVPTRISLKFRHDREQHVAECTTCHINITREASVRGLRPDVPISACATCHKTSTDKNTQTIETEVETRDKSETFVCAKCHVASIGGQKAPIGHRAILAQ